MHMQESLRTISKWGKFLGYVYIVTGVLTAIYLVGILNIFLGLYLLRSAKKAEELQRGYEERTLEALFENYAKFVKLNGIVFLIVLAVYAIAIALFFALGLSSVYYL